MKAQLVIQFAGGSLVDFDALIALEDQLTAILQDVAVVDGHDIGSGQANIFVLTSDPEVTFQRVLPTLEKTENPQLTAVAYRQLDEENYRVIWPKDSQQPFRVV